MKVRIMIKAFFIGYLFYPALKRGGRGLFCPALKRGEQGLAGNGGLFLTCVETQGTVASLRRNAGNGGLFFTLR